MATGLTLPALSGDVYLIRDGRIGLGSVNSPLPEAARGRRFGPGVLPQVPATLSAVQGVVARCAPWLTVYLGPKLWSIADSPADYDCRATVRRRSDGRVEYEHHGLSLTGRDVVMVAASARLPTVLATVHHEIWHAIERHLHPADLAIVDAAVARGEARPGEYLDSMIERRARSYEYWACARDEGLRPASLCSVLVDRIDRIFEFVHSGALARDRVAGRPIRAQEAPGRRTLRTIYRLAVASVGWPMTPAWVIGVAVVLIYSRA